MASEIKVDTISEKTSANGVTIDGVSLKDSKVATANSIDSDAYVDGSIDAVHLSANSVDSAAYVDGSIDAVHMSADSIDSASYVDLSIDTAHIGALQVTGAKLNTDAISAQTALTAEPADTDEFMVSDAGVLKRIDYSLIKSANTPAFQANLSGNLSISHSTTTKVAFDTETYDSDGCYDPSTNYRFTPAVVGKYLIYVRLGYNEHNTAVNSLTDQAGFYARIYKNGTSVADVGNHSAVSSLQSVISANAISIVDLDADDYVEAYTLLHNNNNNNSAQLKGNVAYCEFGGYKIIT